MSAVVTAWSDSAIALSKVATVRALAFRSSVLIFENIISIGFMSGLYGGKNHNSAPLASILVMARGDLWA